MEPTADFFRSRLDLSGIALMEPPRIASNGSTLAP